MTEPIRVLPADVFDALELSALAFGGIGARRLAENVMDDGWEPSAIPVCAYGHANSATVSTDSAMSDALWAAQIGSIANDRAVGAINARRHRPEVERVPFAQWCKELNVIRGS